MLVANTARYRAIGGAVRHIRGRRPSDRLPSDPIMAAPPPSLLGNDVVSLRHLAPAIRDQAPFGTCVANAALEAMGLLEIAHGRPDPELSRFFAYWLCRKREGVPPTDDSGCQVRDMMLTLQEHGAPPEALWPYVPANLTAEPSIGAYDAAELHQLLFFYRCPTLGTVRASIRQGFPVVIGFSCPENFFSDECAKTGIVQYPERGETFDGGHAVMAGVDDPARRLIGCQNSWGPRWGDGGWLWLPYEMFSEGYVDDCWSVRREEL